MNDLEVLQWYTGKTHDDTYDILVEAISAVYESLAREAGHRDAYAQGDNGNVDPATLLAEVSITDGATEPFMAYTRTGTPVIVPKDRVRLAVEHLRPRSPAPHLVPDYRPFMAAVVELVGQKALEGASI